MREQENYTTLKTKLPLLLASLEGVKDVCRALFKNDRGEPLEVTTYQAHIIKRIFFKSPKRIICTAMTRAGKSLAIAIGVCLLSAFRPGEKIRLIAPTEEHTKIVMGYVIQHILDSELVSNQLMFDVAGMGIERLRKELTKRKLTFRNGSEVMTITANITGKGRSLVGWGGTAVFVDEGEQIDAEIMRTKIMRMLGDTEDASIFMIGNPVTHGYMWEKHTDPAWSFTKIGWRECVAEGRVTQEFIDERKAEQTTAEFKIWYEADWPAELEDQLFTSEDLTNLKTLSEEDRKLLESKPEEKHLGVDVARFGSDFTVLCKAVRYGEKWFFTEMKRFEKKATTATTGEIIAWDRKEKFKTINVDDTGLGGGVTDQLKEVPQTRNKTHAFIAGESPWKLKRKLTRKEEVDNKQFFNKKAFWFRQFETLAKKDLVKIACPVYASNLHNELKKMRYEFSSTGKLRIIDPEDKSPDFADAACYALYKAHRFAFAFA